MKILALVAAGVVLAAWLTSGDKTGRTEPPPAPGTVVTLRSDCPSMPTERGWKDVYTSMRQGDRASAAVSLVERGGFFIAKGTNVMVKNWIFPSHVEISIQNGKHMGARAFTSWACAWRGGL